jgi:hypothetical protein
MLMKLKGDFLKPLLYYLMKPFERSHRPFKKKFKILSFNKFILDDLSKLPLNTFKILHQLFF